MKVRKSTKQPDPKYPSHRQFLEYKRLLGAATIGLTAVTGWSDPAAAGKLPPEKLGGKTAVEPKPPEEPNRLEGDIAVEPRPAPPPEPVLAGIIKVAAPQAPASEPVRLVGKPAEARPTPPPEEPQRLRGEMAAEPAPTPPGEPAVEPTTTPDVLPAPKPAETNLQACATYTVKKGDTLSAIAKRLLGDSERWPDLVAANQGLTADTLKAGQSIALPAAASTNETDAVRVKGMR